MSHKPPVPPDQQSPATSKLPPEKAGGRGNTEHPGDKNLKEQDQQGNTYQNTRNQGYQQDR